MRIHVVILASLLTAAAVSPLAGDARADTKVQEKPKATKASVLSLAQRLERARDAIRSLARTPAPEGLTAEQKKVYQAEMKKTAALADGTDDVVHKMSQEVDQAKSSLDSLSEMGETESLRLQMAMDRLSKMMSTLSNLLKKISDTAQTITQNLK